MARRRRNAPGRDTRRSVLMQEQSTTAARDDEVDEAANLVDALFGLVTERRTLSYDERHKLRHRVSDRIRELVPYVDIEAQEGLWGAETRFRRRACIRE
jgi:hypothetical protein